MVKVTVTISKRMFQTVERECLLPSDWSEVQPHLIISIIELLQKHEPAFAKVKCLELFLGLPKVDFLAISEANIVLLCECLAWLEISISSKPLIKSFKHNDVEYFLPIEGMENAKAIEYPLADAYFESYINDGTGIENLIGVLCREQNPDEAERIQFGDERVTLRSRYEAERRGLAMKEVSPAIQSIVLMYFMGCKKAIHEAYSDFLFKQKEEDDTDTDDNTDVEPAQEGAFLGWWGIYFDIAESGTFGNLQDVYQTNFHTLCLYLVKKEKEARAYEQKMKQSIKPSTNDL